MTSKESYIGNELDLFQAARRWKNYWSGKVRPYLGADVLEVGAGFGANTPYLLGPGQERWTCLEPDEALASRIPEVLSEMPWRERVETRVGTLQNISEAAAFTSILYIDVLEHIEDDHDELQAAVRLLRPGGVIVVLSPAHPWLFTEFDRALGHFRRYTRKAILDCTPAGASLIALINLDAMGLFASAANRLLLHQSLPTATQIEFWDRWLVSNSRWIDPLLSYRLGKSILAVWRRD